MPVQGGRVMPWTTKPAKASTAPTLEALGFGDASAHSHPTQAMKRRCSSKEKYSRWDVGKPLGPEGCRPWSRGAGKCHITADQGWLAASQKAEIFFFSQLVSYAGGGGRTGRRTGCNTGAGES